MNIYRMKIIKTKLVKIATVLVFILSSNLQGTEVAKSIDKRLFSDDIKEVQKAIAEGVDVNAKNEYGSEALMLACAHNKLEIAELLINSGANFYIKNELGNTPLMLAVLFSDLELIKLLIDFGADFDTKNTYGETVLMAAEKTKTGQGIVKLIKDRMELEKEKRKEVSGYLSASDAQILPPAISSIINEYL